jgi:uncharacterized protein YkwD
MLVGRRLRLLAVLAVAVIAFAACTKEEADVFNGVNQYRNANGVAGMEWNEELYAKARNWSQHMANQGRLSHSTLTDGLPAGWRVVGENVGVGSSVEQVLQGLKNSAPHRANMLNPRFTKTATGVIEANGRFWVTQVFIG